MLSALLDIVFPRVCFHCEANLHDTANAFLCYQCWYDLKTIRHGLCRRCGYPCGTGVYPDRCLHCRSKDFRFREVRAGAYYQGLARSLVVDFKFNGMVQLRYPLAAIITRQLRRVPLRTIPAAIVPVPVYRKTLRERGYNQAALLAHCLGSELRLPVLENVLFKVKNIPPQASLVRARRRRNIEGAFVAAGAKNLHGKNVLLVDDVLTTGSTASECARVLKQRGVRSVCVAAAARTTEKIL